MDPMSAATGAIPMITGLLDKGMDLAKGVMDMANEEIDIAGGGEKIGGEGQQPQGPVNY
ncbi:hypothetical protein ACJ6YJ_17340 [Pseudomonas marginalis]|uniref:hypothetical protein n=1 Tax=Pseudomonas TaxID=286 RepID=UPI000812824F|nr:MULTISPECIES: hypothetical protein [Pseudomonas]CRM42548.1 hypothetical protein [Pseudomonas sp. 8 R 14]SAM33622.1 hypothetical protein BN1864_LIB5394:03669 [Pseudomonas sp. 1 R 17]